MNNLSTLEGVGTMTTDEMAEWLGVSRFTVLRAIKAGELPSVRIGRRVYICVPALLGMLRGEKAAS